MYVFSMAGPSYLTGKTQFEILRDFQWRHPAIYGRAWCLAHLYLKFYNKCLLFKIEINETEEVWVEKGEEKEYEWRLNTKEQNC